MSKKVLPVDDPLVKTYPQIACPYAILQSKSSQAMIWLVTHSMVHTVYYDLQKQELKSNLASPITPWGFVSLYDICPFFSTHRYERTMIKQLGSSFISFVNQCIENANYVHTDVNVAAISQYGIGEDYACHNVFIYGIEDEHVHCLDVINNKGFSSFVCSANEMEKAFYTYKRAPSWKTGFEDVITIHVHQPPVFRPEYPPPVYSNSKTINSYVTRRLKEIAGYCDNDYMIALGEYGYGIGCYAILESYFKLVSTLDPANSKWSRQTALSFLEDHKRVMYYLFSAVVFSKEMADAYSTLLQMARRCVFYNIKYELTNDVSIIDKLVSVIVAMRKIEQSAIDKYLTE